MKVLHMVAFTLLVLGGLNLGLTSLGVGVIGSLVDAVGLGGVFNLLVGVSAVYIAATHMKDCKVCTK